MKHVKKSSHTTEMSGRAVAQTVGRRGGRRSIALQSMWDLLWTKWQWDRFQFSPVSVSSPVLHTHSFIYHRPYTVPAIDCVVTCTLRRKLVCVLWNNGGSYISFFYDESNYALQRFELKAFFYLLSHLINIHRISYKTFVFLCPYLVCPTKRT
jgi:hypothetical protein